MAPNEEAFLGTKADVLLSGKDVRSRHARIFIRGQSLYVEPIDQALLAVNGKPIGRATLLVNGDWLALGSVLVLTKISECKPQALFPKLSQNAATDRVITIGRLQACDVVIPSPLVSRHHANMHCKSGQVLIQDLNSTNGTFINGRRAIGPVSLHRDDILAFASFFFRFTGEALQPIDPAGLVHVQALGLCKDVRDRTTGKVTRLLDDISLAIKPGEFAAIFGTSGSGKSTLLDALNGQRPATSGQVLYNGTNLYSSFDSFRNAIGYVPQQDIVHRRILVHRALQYTARLRLPRDTSRDEIANHIERVLTEVGLGEKAFSPIDTPSPLSGGELKRVSLAVELIANPNILFLDEVTSGLDAGIDNKMMHLFAQLASAQKTVICVTHTLENIDLCHLVALLHKGKLVYFGPPNEALGYFGISRLLEVYELIESRPAEQWADQYLQSPLYDAYIEKRSFEMPLLEPGRQSGMVSTVKAGRLSFRWSQLATLLRRYLDLLVADRRNLAILLLQAPFVATLIGLVFSASGSPHVRALGESHIAFMLVLSAIWCGCLNSTREVIKELPVYLRERSVNLGIGPYLLSKLIPLCVLCALQSFALLGIATLLLSWSGAFWSRLAVLFLSAIAATCMGLAVSTFVDSSDKAVALVPILLIPQVIFSGAIVTLGKTGEVVARHTIISYSAFDAMKTTMSEEVEPFLSVQWNLSGNLKMILALVIVFLMAALLGLKFKDIRR